MRSQAGRRGCKLDCGTYAWDLIKDSRVIRIGRRQYSMVEQLASSFDSIFETLEPKQTGHQFLIDFSHIQLHKHRASGLKFELAQWPEPDSVINAYLEWYQPTSEDLSFDLGAGCGISTYALSNLSRRVVAFEPDPQLRVILERNVQRHGMTNVVVAKESVSNLADLVSAFGVPAFCKMNLDQLAPEFWSHHSENWNAPGMHIAAHGKLALRERLVSLLNTAGAETGTNEAMGMLWARRASDALA
jgi:hypothetical protein